MRPGRVQHAGRCGVQGRDSGQAGGQHHAQGVHVGRRGGRAAAGQLRRGVGQDAFRGRRLGLAAHRRQPEVGQLHPVRRQHDVGRDQVPVRDAGPVRDGQRGRRRRRYPQRLARRERALRQPLGQRLAAGQLPDEVRHGQAAGEHRLAEVVDLGDARVR